MSRGCKLITRRHLLLAAAAGFGGFTGAGAQTLHAQDTAASGEEPDSRRFMLEDVNGTIVTDEDLLGRFCLIYFGYTSCPDICSTSLTTMANVLKSLDKDAGRILLLFVTLDPDRDTRKLLSEYVSAFDERIVALRGPKPYLDAMVKAFNAKYAIVTPDPSKPENYTIDHTSSIIFMDPDGQLIARFGHGLAAEAIAGEVRKALARLPATQEN